jgi:NADH:ubiquinone oxidoreductase subunit F (NADH-binding)
MQGKCLCALGEFATMAVRTSIAKFREDFLVRVEQLEHA